MVLAKAVLAVRDVIYRVSVQSFFLRIVEAKVPADFVISAVNEYIRPRIANVENLITSCNSAAGSHDELMDKNGKYASMFKRQAANYLGNEVSYDE